MPISDVRLMDCMDFMKEFPDKFFDLAIVDPPYGIGYSQLVGVKLVKHGWKDRKSSDWDNAMPPPSYFVELNRVSKNQIIWGGNYFSMPATRGFIIWDKEQRIDQADCEFAWSSFNRSARVFRYARGNESGFAPKSSDRDKGFANIHPTQKPIALYNWILANYAESGDKILDTHLGSGSSRVAAYKLGFDFWGSEIDQDYFDAQERRFKEGINEPLFQTTPTLIQSKLL